MKCLVRMGLAQNHLLIALAHPSDQSRLGAMRDSRVIKFALKKGTTCGKVGNSDECSHF